MMRGALAVGIVGIVGVANGFVIPVPSNVVSGRATRESTSQVIFMGRGDMRTAKGKRTRASYGVSRSKPNKKIAKVFIDGAVVDKPAPVTRTWDEVDEREYEPAEDEIAAEGASAVPGANVASYYTAAGQEAVVEKPVMAAGEEGEMDEGEEGEMAAGDETFIEGEPEAEAEPADEEPEMDGAEEPFTEGADEPVAAPEPEAEAF